MKTSLLALMLTLAFGLCSAGWGQTVEVAKRCDVLQQQLQLLIKDAEAKRQASGISPALGVTELTSCGATNGKVTCFQCLDTNQELRSLQVFQDAATGRYEFLGFGCRCREDK